MTGGAARRGAKDKRGGKSAVTDERGDESAADKGGNSERDSGERGGATDKRGGDSAVAVSGAARGESAAGQPDGRTRQRRECGGVGCLFSWRGHFWSPNGIFSSFLFSCYEQFLLNSDKRDGSTKAAKHAIGSLNSSQD